MTARLFAYGTLALPAVMEAVTGRRFPGRPARLCGFERRSLRGRIYPAVVETPGGRVEGRLYEGIDGPTLARLDRFEGPLYVRRRLPVAPAGEGAGPAEVYVLAEGARAEVLPEPWDPAEFVSLHLPRYLRSCEAFRAADARGKGAR